MAEPRDGYIDELDERCAAWVQPPGGWFVSNAGVISTAGGVLLVDTCATERRTAQLLDAAARIGPLAGCVLTHGHGDHFNGLGQLPGDVPVYASPATTQLVRATGIERFTGVFEQPDWGDLTLRVPDRVLAAADS